MSSLNKFKKSDEEIYESAKNLLENVYKASDGKLSYEQCGYCGIWKESLEMDFCEKGHMGNLFCKDECLYKCTQCHNLYCMNCLEFEGTYGGNCGIYFPQLEEFYECPTCD